MCVRYIAFGSTGEYYSGELDGSYHNKTVNAAARNDKYIFSYLGTLQDSDNQKKNNTTF